MKLEFIRGLYNIRARHAECVATIGNFDGVHIGHQKVLANLTAQAKQLKLPSLVITFEPLPQEYFLAKKAPARLSRLREKLMLFKQHGVDRVLCLRFNANLANLAAEDFITDILVKKLGIRYLIVGDDFRFGKQRAGDFNLLQEMGKKYHFQVEATKTIVFNEERIGSSRIRMALVHANFSLAAQLLGRSYHMSGHVVHGNKLGKELGFPTINIPLPQLVIPLRGIFAVKIHGLSEKPLLGAASIGNRPVVDGKRDWLEVNIFDFNQNVYGRFVEIEFVQKLREELNFDSLKQLKEQITKDVAQAREALLK